MLIKFINKGWQSYATMQQLLEELQDYPYLFLFRRDGYVFNKSKIESHMNIDNGVIKSYDDIVVYTDDEQMLQFAQYNNSIHNYNVEIMFDDNFIPLKVIHPNIREINNIVSMFQREVFDDDYREIIDKFDTSWCDVPFAD